MINELYIIGGIVVTVTGLVAWILWYAKKDAKKDVRLKDLEKTTEAYKNAEKIANHPVNSVDDIITRL